MAKNKKLRSLEDIELDDEELVGLEDLEDEEEKEGVVEGSAEHDPVATVKGAPKSPEAVDVLDATIEQQVTQLGRSTAEVLRKSPKEKIMIPVDKLNEHDSYVLVGINGWNFQIQRGVPVVLPVQVVDLLADAGYAPTRVR